MFHFRRLLILVVLALTIPVAAASASGTQEPSFQDNRLLLQKPAQLAQTLQTLKDLGVKRLRISVNWYRVAPSPNSRAVPRFNALDPNAYPAANWAPYDTIVLAGAKYGMGVNFDLMGGAPLWAVPVSPKLSESRVWYPNATLYGQFVAAVATRYSGNFVPAHVTFKLPRVNYWSIWNEPNVGDSSLSPQTVNGVEVGPRIYRSLVAAAWSSLMRTGHTTSRDTILVGELASTGHPDPGYDLGMQPLRFVRALFCVDANYRPLRGRAAAIRGCPTTAAGSRSFRRDNPGLFSATGWSHHPYHLTEAPNVPAPPNDADWVIFSGIPRLENALDRVQRAYGSGRHYSIYLTEYGFNTNPPQRFNAVGLAQQAAFLNQAEYMAYRDPRVQTLTQYTLQDTGVNNSYYSAFAAGLIFANGSHKPSFDAYRLPIFMPATRTRRGRSLVVWGCIRPADFTIGDTGSHARAQLQFQSGNSGRFLEISSITITNAKSCYFVQRLKFPSSGTVRVAYTYPASDHSLAPNVTAYSRAIRVTLR